MSLRNEAASSWRDLIPDLPADVVDDLAYIEAGLIDGELRGGVLPPLVELEDISGTMLRFARNVAVAVLNEAVA